MRAMVLPRFGGPDNFELREIDIPEVGHGQLLVRVMASGTNPVEAKIRQNGYFAGVEPPLVLGYDVSGVIEQVGPGVKGFTQGDEVYYTPEIAGNRSGSYAEYNVVSADIVAHKPTSLDHISSAAVPLAGGTAYEAIIRRLRVSVGETILIHGGAGGVGSFAVQLAKSAGARVIATAGPDNQQTLRDLGADIAIDYRSLDPFEVVRNEMNREGVDAVFDTVGGTTIQKSLPITRRFGRLAGILGATGDLTEAYRRNQTYYGVMLTRDRERLRILRSIIEQGSVRPLVDQVLRLEDVARAHHRLDSGHGRGKIILNLGK